MHLGSPSGMYVCSEDESAPSTHSHYASWLWTKWMEELGENVDCTRDGVVRHTRRIMNMFVIDASCCSWCYCSWDDVLTFVPTDGELVWTATLGESRSALFTWHHETTFPFNIQFLSTHGECIWSCRSGTCESGVIRSAMTCHHKWHHIILTWTFWSALFITW